VKTQDEINAIAERIRATGTPDSLNRWLGMTPEKLAECEQQVARQSAADRQRRSTTMPRVGATMPRVGATMPRVGAKEAALRQQREGDTEAVTAPATKKPKAEKPAKTADTAKPEPAKKAARQAARTPVQDKAAGSAVRPGSKMETIKKLLARKNGCTSAEVKEACDWPSVSMPQQAAAIGVKLFKLKGEDGVTRYADHKLD
jgi:hypothetical protein